MNKLGGINLLRDDDPVLNRPMFARFANGGEVQTEIEDESDLGFTAPPLEVGAPPGREAAQETIVEDQVKEEPMQTIPEATSVPSAQTQTQGQMFTNKDKVMLALLPIASQLLNATTPRGGSDFSSFLSAAGRGLATIPQTLMGIKQLEAKGLDTKVTKRSDIQFTKPFTLDGKTFQTDQRAQLSAAEINAISQVDPTAIVPYKDPSSKAASLKEFDRAATYISIAEAKKRYPNNIEIQQVVGTNNQNLIGRPVIKNNRQVQIVERFEGNRLVGVYSDFSSKQPVKTESTPLTIAQYFPTREEAEDFLRQQNITPETTGYELVLKELVNPDKKPGSTIFKGGIGLMLVGQQPDRAGAPLSRVSLLPEKDFKDPLAGVAEAKMKEVQKRMTEAQASFRELEPRVSELLRILQVTETGAVESALLPFRKLAAGILKLSPKEMEKLSNQELIKSASDALAPQMRIAGSGSTSDMEFEAYRNAAISLRNTPKANYINLYMLKNLKRNALKAQSITLDAIRRNPEIREEDIDKLITAKDQGLFAVYDGDPEDTEQIKRWFNSQPRGTVVVNEHKVTGKPLISSNGQPLSGYLVADGMGGILFENEE